MILEELIERLDQLVKDGCSKFEIDLMQEEKVYIDGGTVQLQSRIKDVAVCRKTIILIGKEID